MHMESSTSSLRRAAALQVSAAAGLQAQRLAPAPRGAPACAPLPLGLASLPPQLLGERIGDFLALPDRQAGLGLTCTRAHAALRAGSADPVLRRVLQHSGELAAVAACRRRLDRALQATERAQPHDAAAPRQAAMQAADALAAAKRVAEAIDMQGLRQSRDDLKRVDRALRQLQIRAATVSKPMPRRAQPHEVQAAELLLHLGRLEQADLALRSVCFGSTGHQYAIPLAAIAIELGRHDLGAMLAQARTRPDDEHRLAATFLLAKARYHQGNLDEALAVLEAFQGEPHALTPWALIAMVHHALGNQEPCRRAAQLARNHLCTLPWSMGEAGLAVMDAHLGNTQHAVQLMLALANSRGLLDFGVLAALRSPAVVAALACDARGADLRARLAWAQEKASAVAVTLWHHVAREAEAYTSSTIWELFKIERQRPGNR